MKAKHFRRGAKRSNPVPCTNHVLDLILDHGGGAEIEPCEGNTLLNPGILALPPLERELWSLISRGVSQFEAGKILRLRPDQVCRSVREIRAKIRYLAVVRDILLTEPMAFHRFMEGKLCQFCRSDA